MSDIFRPWEPTISNTYETCSRCKKSGPDVSRRLNRYQKEINDIEIYEILCDDCDEDIAGDI